MNTSENKTIMIFHEKFRRYDLGDNHPFRGDRFANAIKFFESQGLFSLSQIVLVVPQPVSREELLRIHKEDYVDLIFRLANESKPYDFETLALLHVSFTSTGFNLALVWYVIVVD